MEEVTLRPITTLDEIDAVISLQRAVWGMRDDSGGVVPNHLLITAAHHGGVLIGAFTPDNTMVGFVFGFLGSTEDERAEWMGSPYLHCSHMLAVLPEYRRHGLAVRLKEAQREQVISQNIKLIIWTVDPLLAGNALLNIQRLGGIVRTYHPNLYGELRESLNADLPTDRFELEWWISSQRVKAALKSPHSHQSIVGAKLINRTAQRSDGLRVAEGWEPQPHHGNLIVEIPADFQGMRAADLDLAYAWRMQTRDIFTWAFGEKYVLAAVASEGEGIDRRNFYLLTRSLDLPTIARDE